MASGGGGGGGGVKVEESAIPLVALLTIGTTGDVVPFLALGTALFASGKVRVAVVTHASFREKVEAAGLVFGNIGPDPSHERLYSPEGKALASASRFSAVAAAKKFMQPMVDTWATRALHACRELKPSYLVFSTLPSLCCLLVAESLRIKFSVAHLAPFYPTAFHAPPVGFGDARVWFKTAARTKWYLAESMGWKTLYRDPVNRVRIRECKLSAVNQSPQAAHVREKIPHIMGYSSVLCPKPADFPPHVHVTGQWFQVGEEEEKKSLPETIVRFLDAKREGADSSSKDVVFVTFGSMLQHVFTKEENRVAVIKAIVKAIIATGLRALVSTKGCELEQGFADWDYQISQSSSSDVLLVPGFLPHRLVMAECLAVVCHGGSGTVHTCVRVGRPVMVIPALPSESDQPFWEGAVARAELGPRIGYASLSQVKTGNRLQQALKDLVARPAVFLNNVARTSQAMKSEGGSQLAASLVLEQMSRHVKGMA